MQWIIPEVAVLDDRHWRRNASADAGDVPWQAIRAKAQIPPRAIMDS
jgi:hypothetical protein